MVRFLIVLAVASGAGCSFSVQTDHDKQTPGDARGSGVDVDAAPDAAGPPPPDGPKPGCADGDDDHDGVCNAVDDWPCGARPTDPPASHVFPAEPTTKTTLSLSSIALAGADTRSLAIRGGGTFTLATAYGITDKACTQDCSAQIEVGLSPIRAGCLFDAKVSKQLGATGQGSFAIDVPFVTRPTVFELRARIGHNFSCTYDGADTWYYGEPGAARTIAYVCVY